MSLICHKRPSLTLPMLLPERISACFHYSSFASAHVFAIIFKHLGQEAVLFV